ncbi:MAG: hypothetical protein ICV75_09070, partial [Nitrospiraceae bacterium]|nr:hypothetical protein [Nitrospiraceae bacterium]
IPARAPLLADGDRYDLQGRSLAVMLLDTPPVRTASGKRSGATRRSNSGKAPDTLSANTQPSDVSEAGPRS